MPLPPAAPEKAPSEVKQAEPQPPAAPRNGAQALSLVVGPRADDSPTVLPPPDNIGSAPSPTPPAQVGLAAQSFAGRSRTPSALVSPSATGTLALTSPLREAQTRAIFSLMLQHRRLEPQDEDVLSLHQWVNQVVKFARRPAHLTQLVQELLRPAGLYGANPEEWLSAETQQQLFDGWLSSVLFNQTFEALLADQVADAGRRPSPHTVLVGQLRHRLHQLLHQHDTQGGTLNYPARKYLLEGVAGTLAPALVSWPRDRRWSALSVLHLRWAYAHAGLRLAAAAGITEGEHNPLSALSVDEATDLGFSLALALSTRALLPEYLELFQLPALLRYRYHFPDAAYPEEELRSRALERFILDVDTDMLANDPVRQFGLALEAWRSRRRLAQDAIIERCPEQAGADAAATLQADTESYLNAHGPWPYPCLSDERQNLAPLPDIDERFARQNTALARQYATVEMLVLSDTFARMDAAERDFIHQAQVTFARAERSPVAAFSAFELSGLHFSGQSVLDLVLELLPGVELLVARQQQDERIYALQLQQGRYLLARVDRDNSRYHDLFPAPRHYPNKRYDLKLHLQEEKLKHPGAPLEALAMTLASHHQAQFSAQLHQQGYDVTFRDKALDFLLSLVPFYDCIRLLRRGEAADALQPCAFDALSLIPVIGEASVISLRFGTALGRGGLFAVRHAVKVMACEQLLTAALKQGGAVFVRHGMLPAARQLTPRAFAALGIASLRSLDPGFELAGYIGRAGAARLIDFARFLQPALPSLGNVINRFDARLLTAMPPVAPVYRTGRLPGLDREVPLVALGGDTYRGQTIFVRVNPYSGDVCSIKYTLSPEGVMREVPKKLAVHLRNIRTQGLGGERLQGGGAQVGCKRGSADAIP